MSVLILCTPNAKPPAAHSSGWSWVLVLKRIGVFNHHPRRLCCWFRWLGLFWLEKAFTPVVFYRGADGTWTSIFVGGLVHTLFKKYVVEFIQARLWFVRMLAAFYMLFFCNFFPCSVFGLLNCADVYLSVSHVFLYTTFAKENWYSEQQNALHERTT